MRTFIKVFSQLRLMSQNVIWSCPTCDEQTRFKGLCRECTEYENGVPVKPVHRVRLNHEPTQQQTQKKTRSDYLNQRRPRPSKKQLESMMETLNEASKIVNDEEDFTPVGEAIKDIQDMGFAVVNDLGEEE